MDYQIPKALQKFAAIYLSDSASGDQLTLQPLSGDAGFRRYYRTISGVGGASSTAIAVDSPPAKEANLAYVRTNLLLESLGVRVPKIQAVDFLQGFFLLEDLGGEHLKDQLAMRDAGALYSLALDQLDLIQSCQAQPANIPDYDRALLSAELNLFSEWFLQKLLGIAEDAVPSEALNKLFEALLQEALSQPKVLVHRDYHSRNLMCLDSGGLAVIDFQDAVWGPITYDFVSLARDCYQRWLPSRLDAFVEECADRLLDVGKIDTDQRAHFRRWFDFMGLQRHIKVLGIFARLYLRDDKAGYLTDLPLVIRYTLEVLDQYPEGAEISNWMQSEVIPLCEKEPWYSDWRQAGSESELA